jgi:hypothetical protein
VCTRSDPESKRSVLRYQNGNRGFGDQVAYVLIVTTDIQTDAALRACADIPDSQAVIMMIAVGSLPEEFTVAQSPRKHLDEVIVFH